MDIRARALRILAACALALALSACDTATQTLRLADQLAEQGWSAEQVAAIVEEVGAFDLTAEQMGCLLDRLAERVAAGAAAAHLAGEVQAAVEECRPA